jgi:cytochrome b
MRFLAVIPSHWFDYVAVAGVAFCLGWGMHGSGGRRWPAGGGVKTRRR